MPDLTALHEALAGVVLGGRGLTEVLTEITAIARPAIPGAEASSITLIRREEAFTAAFDGRLAMEADELQYQRGYGPCVDAGRAGQVFLVEDMRQEQRWPDYARHVAALGVRSSLSVPLPFQGVTIGALNSYSAAAGSFGEADITVGQEVAAWVALAVGNADMIARTVDELAGMRMAMASRAVIEQAKGILMERHQYTEDQAFTDLTRASQNTNTKLRDVAEELVRTRVYRNGQPRSAFAQD